MEKLWQAFLDNAGFVAVCLGIIAGIYLLARLSERRICRVRKVSKARRLTIVAVCGALASVLMLLEFPLPFLAPDFYKLDFSELPVLLAGFYLGPSAAVACEGLKVLLKLFMKGTSTMFIGDFANFVVGCLMVLPAVVIYHRGKGKKSAFLGLTVGSLSMTVLGSAFNALYLLPKFAQTMLPMEVILDAGRAVFPAIDSVWSLVLLCVVPLNLIKALLVSTLTLLLYKKVARPLFGK